MPPVVRRFLPLLLVVPLLAACGGSKRADVAGLETASSRTVGGGTASFTLSIKGTIAGASVYSSETGAVSFTARRAHFYKLVAGGGMPQEIVLDGPFAYTNANVEAALKDTSVKPWTKLEIGRAHV